MVLFHEESTGRSVRFDCSDLPVAEPVRNWLVRRLAERAGARSGVKRATSFRTGYQVVRDFAHALAQCELSPGRPADITAEHIRAFMARYEDPQTRRTCTGRLRIVLRDCPELPESARRELFETRLPVKQASQQVTAYPEGEWQQIMTALRRDIRLCRDRIRAGTRLLERFRAGEVGDGHDAELAQLLDLFVRTGDLPRRSDGGGAPAVQRCGGVATVMRMLTLSQQEATAFAILLSVLTAENLGTVAGWPALHQRSDGIGDEEVAVALVEQRKPRRGPEREHRVAAVEDLPVSLRSMLERTPGDEVLFHSPLRVYELLVELTAPARLISGMPGAFVHRRLANPAKPNSLWSEEVRVERWARTRGFPTTNRTEEGGPPGIDMRRVRQTALESQRRPVSHTARTLRDHYLRRSQTVRDQSQYVVAEALQGEVDKAREAAKVVVLPSRLLALAAEDLPTAAAQAGVAPETLRSMLAAERDTAVVACRDHLDSPHAPAGEACPASFLHACLNCPNARALPHHLPVQIALHDQLKALRSNIDPRLWAARYATPLARLRDILSHYSGAEHAHARASITDRHHALIVSLLDGRTDLR
ncbi:hypothetical protein [Streptomyces sp. NBC_01244]|uniref:hypothetical protein n=1 Tax=Streptomyces sp. NBC_01244 TaxID=2903797 RepID=UPI002E0F6938|nr:hypothetical protein OG247_35730 [Streptomyces sp. NBC_01244]WSP44293.1 hypothetical protein OG247_43635 [Streptomyces sp. NBC_01244]